MSDYKKLDLYEHNIRSYERIKNAFKNDNIAAIIQSTGTGKTYNALQLALDNPNKKMLYVVPYESIIEHVKDIINNNDNVSIDKDFKNIEFITYQKLISFSEEEINSLDLDILVLDEFHHIGAPVWGEAVNKIVNSHNNIKILGMSAYTVRDRGTPYERNMIEKDGDELFSDKVVSTYTLSDAISDGVLPKPIYRSAYVNLSKTIEYLDKKIDDLDNNSQLFKDIRKLLDEVKNNMHNVPNMKDVFKNNIRKNGKYIYFCPALSENGSNDIDTIMDTTKEWLYEMGLTDDDFVLYKTTSDMGQQGRKNRKMFLEDKDIDNKNTKNKLRIMFAKNQYNEGVHIPLLDGVILGRSTQSDIVYFEQLGRALGTKGDIIERHNELLNKSYDELYKICKEKWSDLKDNLTKEELVELIESPIIIDLANNIDFIKELENDIKNKVKEKQELSNNNYSNNNYQINPTFNIDMLNEKIFEILKYIEDRLAMTWDDYYNLLKNYYEKNGSISEIKNTYKTINGYEYDENGYKIGSWIVTQRNLKKSGKLSSEREKKLTDLGMLWIKNPTWDDYYELAKKYREHNGNLYIPMDFNTYDGFNYDKDGFLLGNWVRKQVRNYDNYLNELKMDKIHKLEELDIDWNTENYAYLNNYFNGKVMYCEANGIDINSYKDEEIIDKVLEFMRTIGCFSQIPTKDLILGKNKLSYESLNVSYNMDETLFSRAKKEDIMNVLDTLTSREKKLIIRKFGLDGNGEHTLDELSKEFNLSRNNISQAIQKALRRLRNPNRAKYLKPYYEEGTTASPYIPIVEYQKNMYKNKYNHEYDYLIDYIYASNSDKSKMIDSLCNYHLHIKKTDFQKIYDEILDNHIFRSIPHSKLSDEEIQEIIDKVDIYKSLYTAEEALEANGYTSIKNRKKKGV